MIATSNSRIESNKFMNVPRILEYIGDAGGWCAAAMVLGGAYRREGGLAVLAPYATRIPRTPMKNNTESSGTEVQ